MKATEKGVSLTDAELGALLKVATRDIKTDRQRATVLFVVMGDRVKARATNGQMSVEADGDSDGKTTGGPWVVRREFLEETKKLVSGVKQVARLRFEGASLHTATIEENAVEVASYSAPTDAAIANPSFPNLDDAVRLPGGNRQKIAHCASVGAAYLSTIDAIAKAAGVELVDLYAPKDRDSNFHFRAGDGGDTVWTGSISPIPTPASTGGDDGDGPDDDGEFEDDEEAA